MPSSSLGLKGGVKMVDDSLKRILFSAEHNSFAEAILADLVDAIPILGDLTNAIRVKDAMDKNLPDRTVLLQLGDLIGGIIPGVGDIFDIITPTNTITYLLKGKK